MFFWRLLSALLVVYIILLAMRFLLSWFPGAASGRHWQMLLRVTEPYLRLFRGLQFLRRGFFDFTVVAAVLALLVALNLSRAIASYGRFTLGLALSVVAGAVWSGLSFLLILFIVLAALRLIARLFTQRYESAVGQLLEAMVRPLVSLVRSLLRGAPALKEEHLLLLTIAVLVGAHLLGGLLFHLLRVSLLALPF